MRRHSKATVARMAWLVLTVAALSACAGYFPGRQSYWDSKVRHLCAVDGGTTVYEVVLLSPADYARLSDLLGYSPRERNATQGEGKPYMVVVHQTSIREKNPAVGRIVSEIKRRSDGKVLARSIRYWRRGGDLPTGISEPSMFICPDEPNLSTLVFKAR